MVVVGAPALSKRGGRAASVALVEKRLAVHLGACNRHTEVLLPLRLEIGANRLVERVRVIGVGEALDLRAIRVPRLVLGFRGRRVECRGGVPTIAQIALQTFADQTTPPGDPSPLPVA